MAASDQPLKFVDMTDEQKTKVRLEIAHVLFIDIVGYSKLLIDEQSEALQELNQIVRNTEAACQAESAGQLIILPTGDGMALVFTGSVEEPVECALQISQTLRAQPSLPVRMGIHSGPVHHVADVNQRENIAGAGINIAQRVMDCGDAGHILVSKRVADDLAQYRRWQPYLHDLGDFEVKHGVVVSIVNLYADVVGNPNPPARLKQSRRLPPRPVSSGNGKRSPMLLPFLIVGFMLFTLAVLAIIFAPAIIKQTRTGRMSPVPAATPTGNTAASIPEKSVAVLPFENLSRDPDNAYFAEGIQQEILTRLSKIADLKVISRTSTQHYKSAPENLAAIGKQLGVANMVEGSVQKSGDAVRVNVQLIKAVNESHIWAETFDRKLTDIFSVESEVAKAIAEQLRAKLSGQETRVISTKPTNNLEAHDAYLRGLAYSQKTSQTPANALAAQKYLREAVRLDPNFALAWALLSDTDARGHITQALQPTAALSEEARRAGERALALQPDLGEAVVAKGYYHYACLKDYDTAARYFEQARQLLPNSSLIPERMAYLERRRSNWDSSDNYFIEAERLDPRDVGLLTQHALSYIAQRRFTEALRKLEQVLDIAPDDPDTLVNQALIAQGKGDLGRAARLLDAVRAGANDPSALETQIYQTILERQPTKVISRLNDILATPDPAVGFFNGEVRLYLGWVQELGGDHAAAQQSWRQARSDLEQFVAEQPDNYQLLGDLALVSAFLDDKRGAMALAERAVKTPSIQNDGLIRLRPVEILARVAAYIGEQDRAIETIQILLSKPYSGVTARTLPLTPALLRLDPMFDSIRNDPRFQKLAAGDTSPK